MQQQFDLSEIEKVSNSLTFHQQYIRPEYETFFKCPTSKVSLLFVHGFIPQPAAFFSTSSNRKFNLRLPTFFFSFFHVVISQFYLMTSNSSINFFLVSFYLASARFYFIHFLSSPTLFDTKKTLN